VRAPESLARGSRAIGPSYLGGQGCRCAATAATFVSTARHIKDSRSPPRRPTEPAPSYYRLHARPHRRVLPRRWQQRAGAAIRGLRVPHGVKQGAPSMLACRQRCDTAGRPARGPRPVDGAPRPVAVSEAGRRWLGPEVRRFSRPVARAVAVDEGGACTVPWMPDVRSPAEGKLLDVVRFATSLVDPLRHPARERPIGGSQAPGTAGVWCDKNVSAIGRVFASLRIGRSLRWLE